MYAAGNKAILIMSFPTLSTLPTMLDNSVQTLSSPLNANMCSLTHYPEMKSLKRRLQRDFPKGYPVHLPFRQPPPKATTLDRLMLLCGSGRGDAWLSNCLQSTGNYTVLQWGDHLAEDEPRALIVPLTDKKIHSRFIAVLCHMASAFCFLPICSILNSSRRCLGSDSLLQCTHVMPSWCLSRGLSSTQAWRHSCNTNKKLNQTVKKWS